MYVGIFRVVSDRPQEQSCETFAGREDFPRPSHNIGLDRPIVGFPAFLTLQLEPGVSRIVVVVVIR